MVKKLKLQPETFDSYIFLGISTTLKDYRFSYFLNKLLKFNFKKTMEFQFFEERTRTELAFPMYFYPDFEHHIEYCLIQNKTASGILLKEYRQVDYLLIIDGIVSDETRQEQVKGIKSIPHVMMVFELDMEKVRNKQVFYEELELQIDDIKRTLKKSK